MCRFTLYLGPEIRLASLLTEPKHSLIRQSFESRERSEPLNGDGFGVAWYATQGPSEPALFRSTTPAWGNANLQSLARVTSSRCILAHVRAATVGRSAGEANCHPFTAGDLAFMHNGTLGGFRELERRLRASLSDTAYAAIEGQTDSEHIFAMLVDKVRGPARELSADALGRALEETIREAVALSRAVEGSDSSLNLAVANGSVAAITRFTTSVVSAGESLHIDQGGRFVCEEGLYRMLDPDPAGPAVILSSEALSADTNWKSVQRNHLVTIEADGSVRSRPLEIDAARRGS